MVLCSSVRDLSDSYPSNDGQCQYNYSKEDYAFLIHIFFRTADFSCGAK